MPEKQSEYYASPKRDIEPLLPRRVGRALEIGCGTGATMSWLRTVANVEYAMGIEIVPEVAVEANASFDEVVCGDIETLQLCQHSEFDTILVLDVLEHLVDPWKTVRMLRGLLRPSGVLLASIPNAAHWNVSAPLFLRGRWEYADQGLLDRTHLRFFTENTSRALFEDNGFLIEELRYVKTYPGRTSGQRWYIRRLFRHFIPDRLVNFQFLIRARGQDGEPGGYETTALSL